MTDFFWTAVTVILTILLIFAISLFVGLVEYLQYQEKKKDSPS